MKIFLRQKTKLNVSDTASKYKRYIILCAALVLSTIVLFITSFYVGRFTGLNFVSVPKILLSNIFSGIIYPDFRYEKNIFLCVCVYH